MAKGGKGRRGYTRDASGRFASAPGGSGRARKPRVTGGTLAARSSLRRSRAKLAAAPSAAQRGAVTRGARKLAATRQQATTRMGATAAAGRLRPGARRATPAPGNSIRPIPSSRSLQAPPRNAIRVYKPKTMMGKMDQDSRRIDRRIERDLKPALNEMRSITDRSARLRRQMDRFNARPFQDRLRPGIEGEIGRMQMRSMSGQSIRRGEDVVRSRAARARKLAEGGSTVGQRALQLYGTQLAFTGKTRTLGRKKPANTINPGPSNSNPPRKPKPKRRRKGS